MASPVIPVLIYEDIEAAHDHLVRCSRSHPTASSEHRTAPSCTARCASATPGSGCTGRPTTSRRPARGGHRLRLAFADGFVGDVDLTDRLRGPNGPMFEPLQDVEFFARVVVDRDLGTVVWPNGADLAPEVLHEQALSLV